MKYTEREEWILSEGIWGGVGGTLVIIGLIVYLKIPIDSGDWVELIVFGLALILTGMYCKIKARQRETK